MKKYTENSKGAYKSLRHNATQYRVHASITHSILWETSIIYCIYFFLVFFVRIVIIIMCINDVGRLAVPYLLQMTDVSSIFSFRRSIWEFCVRIALPAKHLATNTTNITKSHLKTNGIR